MSPAVPHVDILMTGRTLPPIQERYGDFDRWFQERPGVKARYRVHFLFDGNPVPAPMDSDGWIITGSSYSVNDDLPWFPAVKEGIARSVDDGHPVPGVCFGHQLLAVSTGGRVGLDPEGWELGPATVILTEAGAASPLFQSMVSHISVYQTHQEVVTDLPPGAQVLATNDMGLQAFRLGSFAFGVQFHPEFKEEVARMYVRLRSGRGNAACPVLYTRGENSRQVLTNFIQHLTL